MDTERLSMEDEMIRNAMRIVEMAADPKKYEFCGTLADLEKAAVEFLKAKFLELTVTQTPSGESQAIITSRFGPAPRRQA